MCLSPQQQTGMFCQPSKSVRGTICNPALHWNELQEIGGVIRRSIVTCRCGAYPQADSPEVNVACVQAPKMAVDCWQTSRWVRILSTWDPWRGPDGALAARYDWGYFVTLVLGTLIMVLGSRCFPGYIFSPFWLSLVGLTSFLGANFLFIQDLRFCCAIPLIVVSVRYCLVQHLMVIHWLKLGFAMNKTRKDTI